MNHDPSPLPEHLSGFPALTIIRVETALSRFPIHRIAKRGDVRIELKNQAAALRWEVSYNSKYGQPGPLAYKLDTLVINRTIDEIIEKYGHPVPELIKLGSLKEIAGDLDLGGNTNKVKTALLQDASAFITARISYRAVGGAERWKEIADTRYGIIFTGEALPDGRSADAVYLMLHDWYLEILDSAISRPLDYEYMKALPPAAQRFYEIVSYQVYAALLHKNPRAKLAYSDYCTLSTQIRYPDWDHVKKQMYKVHLPHLRSGYLAKVEYETTTDAEGRLDWNMLYTPGPNAAAEFKAFKGGGNRAVQRLARDSSGSKPSRPEPVPAPAPALPFPIPAAPPAPTVVRATPPLVAKPEPEPVLDPETAGLVAELVASELNHATAVLYARGDKAECRRQLAFVAAMADEDFTGGKGAYLACAIPEKWGPPKQFKARQRRAEAERKKQGETARENTRKTSQEARRDALLAEGMLWIARLEKEHGEAYKAFNAAAAQELETLLRRHAGKMAQESFRRVYQSDKKRLQLLCAYFAHNPCPLPQLSVWLAEHGLELKRLLAER